jgi:hypothetical protein
MNTGMDIPSGNTPSPISFAGAFTTSGVITGNGSGLSSLALANISGIGNIANINLDGNSSTVLYGNGTFAPVSAGSADAISNGNSSVTFTGVDGDVNIVIDSVQTVSITPNAVDITGNITANNLGNIASINIDGSNSNILFGNGTFASAPTPTSIQNGNSKVDFTGVDGDIRFTVDNDNRVQVGPNGLVLTGANTGVSNVVKLDMRNGTLQWVLDNTDFGGGTPFGMNRYNTGFLDPINYFLARGSESSPADVEAGDAAFSERVQVRYNGTNFNTIFNRDVRARSFSPGNAVAGQYQIGSYDDEANSIFQVAFGESTFSGSLTANSFITSNANITGSNVNATQFVVLANDTASNLTGNTPTLAGVAGAMIAVSDQDYQPAHWSVTDNVWKYVSNRANV